MCGIGGIIFKESQVNQEEILKTLEIINISQNMRGPDSSGSYNDDIAFLTHNRLSIIDINPTGAQPMQYGPWIITFNGEIYNYKELRNELINNGHSFIGTSDTEVLLRLIATSGIENTLSKINGIFAFCAYDTIKKEAYLVRDRMGEKPLFYYIDENNTLYFASNPSAIVKALPENNWILDSSALWEYFAMGGIFSEKTLFSGIKRLDSASLLHVTNGIFNFSKYWSPQFHNRITVSDMDSCIKEAINSRTIADVPVVLFLSGGVDSSLVASVIKDIDAVHLISNEVDKAKEVADRFNMKFTIVEPHDFNISDSLLEYSEFSGEPTMAGFIPYITSKEVSKNYKVAIIANGADELFFGYTRIPTPLIPNEFFDDRLKINKININRRSFDSEGQIYHIFRHPNNFTIPILKSNRTVEDINTLINNELKEFSSDFPETSKYRWLELMTYVKGDLNNTLDFASMANSLEVRAPFLDYKLVEYALSLDERQHISFKNGRKHFLKEILHSENVPNSIWERNKVGFSLIDSYFDSIESIKDEAVNELKKEGYLHIHCETSNKERDLSYLRSAALGFYNWKKAWIDSGLIKKDNI